MALRCGMRLARAIRSHGETFRGQLWRQLARGSDLTSRKHGTLRAVFDPVSRTHFLNRPRQRGASMTWTIPLGDAGSGRGSSPVRGGISFAGTVSGRRSSWAF